MKENNILEIRKFMCCFLFMDWLFFDQLFGINICGGLFVYQLRDMFIEMRICLGYFIYIVILILYIMFLLKCIYNNFIFNVLGLSVLLYNFWNS